MIGQTILRLNFFDAMVSPALPFGLATCPSHCSLGERLVAVCDGVREAVKFQEAGRVGSHSCMGDLD